MAEAGARREKKEETAVDFPVSRVVFDLDGTLVDTAPDLTDTMNHVLAGLGRPAVPERDVRHMVGRGARKLIETGLAATGGRLDAAGEDALLERFLAYYGENLAARSRPFPGATALLEALCRAGLALGLCTNKPQAMTDRLMRELALDGYFTRSAGGDLLAVRKPEPGHLQYILDGLGDGGPAVLIGDSEIDVATARAAGVPVILVDFGYSETPARALGADAVIGALGELSALLTPDSGARVSADRPGASK